MKILVIGEEESLRELKARFGDHHEYIRTESHLEARKHFEDVSVIFDFIIEEDPSQFQVFADCRIPVFFNTIKSTLNGLAGTSMQTCFGFNGLPSFVDRATLEAALLNKQNQRELETICSQLGVSFEIVEDRPGMVTPRIVCMIINEAYRAVEEGTATPSDIDIAMKLGTNYPLGPIEWSKKIGLKNVVEVLESVYKISGDERYRICDLLIAEAKRE
jgi:3-hydroxybutyryl-CoA dehydrogenase